ncbi:hypothetical protein [Microbacterium sp. A1-JK]|uniref:hypothetical protein n=1 Tax=Microbacterium sp. A1-JK TaxID=3177516 RepID=UPI0038878EA3
MDNDATSSGGPAGDFQAMVAWASKIGGLLKVTKAQREALTSADTRLGWIIIETDTGEMYIRTATAPQGELIPSARSVFAHAGKVDDGQSTSGGANPTLAMVSSAGGFELIDGTTLRVPVTGRYEVLAQFYFTGSGGGTVRGTVQKNGANLLSARVVKEAAQDCTAPLGVPIQLIAGDRLRLWSEYGNSVFGDSGYETYLSLRRV